MKIISQIGGKKNIPIRKASREEEAAVEEDVGDVAGVVAGREGGAAARRPPQGRRPPSEGPPRPPARGRTRQVQRRRRYAHSHFRLPFRIAFFVTYPLFCSFDESVSLRAFSLFSPSFSTISKCIFTFFRLTVCQLGRM